MIKGLFPRLFSNYKEGGLLFAKFTVGGGGAAAITFTLKTVTAAGRRVSSYNGITMIRTGVGVAQVTVRDGASAVFASTGVNDLMVPQLIHVPATATPIANYFHLLPANFNDTAGTFDFRPTTQAGAAFAEFAMANGDEIHLLLGVNK